jgi:thiosulfate/3-mercaptopyruvate sulfurtransferase
LIHHFRRQPFTRVLLPAFGALCLVLALGSQSFATAAENSTPDPWDKSQIIMAEDLAPLIAGPQGKKPQVIYVGFDFLYKSGHIRDAKFVGTGRDAKGIEALKKWARGIKPGQQVVIYCGCCPFKDCPNIRPAFEALHQMGLTQLKVLYLEEGFGPDWLKQGYPSDKGSAK